ncbi:hypothetical protein WJX84_000200, partial [Apatococcus fuscideae]
PVQPVAGEVVLREGEEDATYVVVDFQDLDKADQPKAGEDIKLEGLDTDQPRLTLPNGCTFTGTEPDQVSEIHKSAATRRSQHRASVSTRDQGHYSSICCSSCGHYFMIGWTDSSRRRRR